MGYDDSCLAAITQVKSIIRVIRPPPNIRSNSVLFWIVIWFNGRPRFPQICEIVEFSTPLEVSRANRFCGLCRTWQKRHWLLRKHKRMCDRKRFESQHRPLPFLSFLPRRERPLLAGKDQHFPTKDSKGVPPMGARIALRNVTTDLCLVLYRSGYTRSV